MEPLKNSSIRDPRLHEIMSTAGPLPENQVSLPEQRAVIEVAIGEGVERAFAQHAEYVTRDEADREHLTLAIVYPRGTAKAEITRYTDTDGTQTADMSFIANKAYDNHWKYVDGPTGRRMLPCRRDPVSGKLTPKEAPADNMAYDATSDSEVIWWSKPWVRNFEEGKPKKPVSNMFRKFLGRGAVTG